MKKLFSILFILAVCNYVYTSDNSETTGLLSSSLSTGTSADISSGSSLISSSASSSSSSYSSSTSFSSMLNLSSILADSSSGSTMNSETSTESSSSITTSEELSSESSSGLSSAEHTIITEIFKSIRCILKTLSLNLDKESLRAYEKRVDEALMLQDRQFVEQGSSIINLVFDLAKIIAKKRNSLPTRPKNFIAEDIVIEAAINHFVHATIDENEKIRENDNINEFVAREVSFSNLPEDYKNAIEYMTKLMLTEGPRRPGPECNIL